MTSAQRLSDKLSKKYKGSKSSKAYQVVNDLINATNKAYMLPYNWEKAAKSKYILIRPVYSQGVGKWTGIADHSRDTESLLRLIGIKFETGNDAPGGGQTGRYIKILTDIDYTTLKS